jgi:hypothetical protein
MRSLAGAACFVSALLWGAVANAAIVEPVQGDLSINQGQGFQKVDTRVDASVGDLVMVGPNGAANIVYPDGCTINVRPGAVVNIAPLSPCASGSFAQQPQTGNGLNGEAILGGALFAAGMGAFIYGVTQSPASP